MPLLPPGQPLGCLSGSTLVALCKGKDGGSMTRKGSPSLANPVLLGRLTSGEENPSTTGVMMSEGTYDPNADRGPTASEMGRKGGAAIMAKYGPDYFKNMKEARDAGLARYHANKSNRAAWTHSAAGGAAIVAKLGGKAGFSAKMREAREAAKARREAEKNRQLAVQEGEF